MNCSTEPNTRNRVADLAQRIRTARLSINAVARAAGVHSGRLHTGGRLSDDEFARVERTMQEMQAAPAGIRV